MAFTTLRVYCPAELTEYLIPALFERGFDSFQELEDGFEGSCPQEIYDAQAAEEVLSGFSGLSYHIKKEEKINWNEAWEKNYDPIIVADQCIVRAAFHPPRPEMEHEIIVTPKMSFGTGHHATTYQMLAYQMTLNHTHKNVLDVGTGTGILAIMAKKRGAKKVTVTDIDDWCIENSTENFQLNHVQVDHIHQGEIEEMQASDFDIILANINKNVLISQVQAYSDRLVPSGTLLLSGFYEADNADIVREAALHGLKKIDSSVKDNWSMLVFSKPSG